MNPYLSETKMPDGTARRPIVERVPECDPPRVRFARPTRPSKHPRWIEEADAAFLALCRHAVEEWARRQTDAPYYVGAVLTEKNHTACNLAAHRLADALGWE